MRISDHNLLLESCIGVLMITLMTALVWPSDLAMSARFMHPVWLAIVVMAARYGPAGLFCSIAFALLFNLSILNLVDNELALIDRLVLHEDMFPFASAVLVAWVAMSHAGSLRRASDRWHESCQDHEVEQERADALQAANHYLRARCDRMDLSIAFWRWLARDLERGSTKEAAAAALAICMARTGAAAGCISRIWADGHVALVSRALWKQDSQGDLDGDKTVCAALEARRARIALDVVDACETDSDVAVPIRDPTDGTVIGVIALGSVDPLQLGPGDLSDLELVSDWLAPSITGPKSGARLHATSRGDAA